MRLSLPFASVPAAVPRPLRELSLIHISQGIDDDMHMDIAAMVMPVRVGAD